MELFLNINERLNCIMKFRKNQKIALLMLLFSAICFSISGYWIVQAIVNPNIPERYKKEDNVQTSADTISLADENAEDTNYVSMTKPETQVATIKQVEQETNENIPIETKLSEDEVKNTENDIRECETIAFNGVSLSQSDIVLLEKTTYAEAGICDEATQRAVAATILERADEREQTIEEVVFEPGQFSCAIDGEIYLITTNGNILTTSEMAKQTSDAVSDAIMNGSGISNSLGGEPLFFYSNGGLDSYEAEKRSTISVSVTLDRVTFYRVWD